MFAHLTSRGVHPPQAMMHFSVLDCPYFRKISQTPSKTFQNFIFSEKNRLFVIDHWFLISSLFSLFQSIPLYFGQIFISPAFQNDPPDFVKFPCFLHTFCDFRFPSTLTRMHLCITQCTYWTPLLTRPIYFLTKVLWMRCFVALGCCRHLANVICVHRSGLD